MVGRRSTVSTLPHGALVSAVLFLIFLIFLFEFPPPPMPGIHITDIEAAINHWRARSTVGADLALAGELAALAEVYALMVYHQQVEADEATMPAAAREAWLAWFHSQPDTPCIAICSTSQGDDVCKGCGRYFEEVQRWTEMTPVEKRATWRRITLEGDSWRFNRYAERALES
jgi:uncharacterized protein